MAIRLRTEAAASTSAIKTVAAETTATTGAEIAAGTAVEIVAETGATDAEIAAAAATATRLADGTPREARPEAIEVGAGAGAVILADAHAVIETTETITGEATGAAVAAPAPARRTDTTAHLGTNAATVTTAGIAAVMRTARVADTAPLAIPRPRGTSATVAPSLFSSWPLACVPAS